MSVLVCLQKRGELGVLLSPHIVLLFVEFYHQSSGCHETEKKQPQGALKKCLTFGMSQRMSASSRHVRVCDRLMSAVTASPQRDGVESVQGASGRLTDSSSLPLSTVT